MIFIETSPTMEKQGQFECDYEYREFLNPAGQGQTLILVCSCWPVERVLEELKSKHPEFFWVLKQVGDEQCPFCGRFRHFSFIKEATSAHARRAA